ncbi:PREDICTED: carboxylesterase 1D-like [Branchiostoma belcheri]|uniref:Carboxylic ester hydrolase n=1 Tax=Branchiostoma belcheri TaxID=7741 RepID=A0A6P5APV8_BRABE|nr:PREDICTED: carboxylesterase 1D-like [Branchiostoma belcheri]
MEAAPRLVLLVLAVSQALLCWAGTTAQQVDSPVVNTVTGQVRGTIRLATDLPKKPVYTYYSIPYAAPPVGERRLRPPGPALPWGGVRDGTKLGPFCPQDLMLLEGMDVPIRLEHTNVSEDCLTVNVYSPTLAENAALPVLLYIHGGGLMVGMGSHHGFEGLAAHQDAVVVTFNYRLAMLGFLSTGDSHAPGNYGLLDQVQAMVWVRDNIRNFGGDPDKVTLFGESAGGVSISYHYLSPMSKGLFNRGISQSGIWQTMPFNTDPLPVAKSLAEELECATETTAIMMECLRTKPFQDIIEKSNVLLERFAVEPFVPTIDGTFMKEHPMDLFERGHINKADYIVGVNNHEFGWMLALAVAGESYGSAILAEYRDPDQPDDPMAIQHQFTQMYGDSMFVAPAVLAAEKHAAAGARVFLYENQYRPSVFPNRPEWAGSDHFDEMLMVSGLPFMEPQDLPDPVTYSETDRKVSLEFMAYWTNFARTGNPADSTGGPTDSPSLPAWPEYTPDNPVYMKLGPVPTIGVGLKPQRMRLWNTIIPSLDAAVKDEL